MISPNHKAHAARLGMAPCPIEQTFVLSEQRDATNLMQQGNNIGVLNPEPADVPSNSWEPNAPRLKKGRLVCRKVFVQQIQAAAKSEALRRAGLPCWSSQALCANLTASATAAKGIRPSQRTLQIKSQERPSATSSSTCQTMIRVPLKVGWPWQIKGSAMMCRPNSIPRAEPFLPLGISVVYTSACLRASLVIRFYGQATIRPKCPPMLQFAESRYGCFQKAAWQVCYRVGFMCSVNPNHLADVVNAGVIFKWMGAE
jgi:hypothetical protein